MSLKSVSLKLAGPGDKKLWDNYAEANGNGLAYHLFAWKLAVEESYGFECPYFMALKDGQMLGALPTVHMRLPLGKRKLVSLPYCDVGGVLAERPEIAEALFNYACEYARDSRIAGIELRHTPELPLNGDSSTSDTPPQKSPAPDENTTFSGKVRMIMDLPESADALLASFKSKLRSQIKKPAKDGLTASLGGVELLDRFYAVFAENMRALGSPVHSRAWLLSVLRQYGDRAKCGVVYMPDNIPAAAGIILCHPKVVSIPWASSLQKFNRFNPNMLLYWSFLAFAADNGYRFFDFGRSTPDEGTYRFKAQWGANPQPLKWEEWKRGKNGFSPVSFPSDSTTTGRGRKTAEAVFRKMPTSTATFFGSRIRKYISL